MADQMHGAGADAVEELAQRLDVGIDGVVLVGARRFAEAGQVEGQYAVALAELGQHRTVAAQVAAVAMDEQERRPRDPARLVRDPRTARWRSAGGAAGTFAPSRRTSGHSARPREPPTTCRSRAARPPRRRPPSRGQPGPNAMPSWPDGSTEQSHRRSLSGLSAARSRSRPASGLGYTGAMSAFWRREDSRGRPRGGHRIRVGDVCPRR